MSFENGMFAHETTDMSLQIEACLWCASLSDDGRTDGRQTRKRKPLAVCCWRRRLRPDYIKRAYRCSCAHMHLFSFDELACTVAGHYCNLNW